MPTWLKVVIGLLLVCLLGVVVLVGGIYYVGKKYGPQFVAGVEKGEKEGRSFGSGTDNQGCLDEGIARSRKAEGITEMMQSNIFLKSCLDASRPTPNFCDDVPGVFEITKTVKWRKDQCQQHGMTGEPGCDQLFQQVQQYCVKRDLDEPGPSERDATPQR